jgi:hypothetical protein
MFDKGSKLLSKIIEDDLLVPRISRHQLDKNEVTIKQEQAVTIPSCHLLSG